MVLYLFVDVLRCGMALNYMNGADDVWLALPAIRVQLYNQCDIECCTTSSTLISKSVQRRDLILNSVASGPCLYLN